MRFQTFLSGCLLILALMTIAPANCLAEWHGNIRLVNEYIYRGYSKSRGNPVVQAQINYQDPSGWFAGLSASQVRFDDQANVDRAEIELKPSVGWNFPVNQDLNAQVFVTGYIFDNKVFGDRADYAELYAALHYQDWLSLTASLAPDAYQRDVNIGNYEMNVRRDILDNLQVSAGLGFNQAEALLHQNYFYWNAGATWFITPNLAIDARYVDASLHEYQHDDNHPDEFYPRPQENKYLLSLTLGF